MIRALIILALLATPAMADYTDTDFECRDGSTMHEVNSVEIIIKRPGEMDVSLPYMGTTPYYTIWAPTLNSRGCTIAPCAIWRFEKGQSDEIFYMLDAGHRVDCKTVDE